MTIIAKTPQSSGAYPSQTWEGNVAPDGYYAIPDSLVPTWAQYAPFVTLTVDNDVITTMVDNPTARAAAAPIADLPALQAAKQQANNDALSAFLAANPLTYTDGKQYGVTLADQQELALNLTQYQLAVSAGETPTLEWHAAHEDCTTWNIADLTSLTLTISAFVYTYVRQNQAIKVQIYAANTADQINAIVISYEVS
jgi:hypothetical protein